MISGTWVCRVDVQLVEGRESGIDLAFGAGFHDMEVHPLHACRFLPFSDHRLGTRQIRVQQQGEYLAWGARSASNSRRLGISSVNMLLTPVRLPLRRRVWSKPEVSLPPPSGMLRFIDIMHTHLGAGAMVQPFFCCAWNHWNHSIEPGWGTF